MIIISLIVLQAGLISLAVVSCLCYSCVTVMTLKQKLFYHSDLVLRIFKTVYFRILINGNTMTDVLGRYFCHECNVERDRVTQDFTCPTCRSGFIGKFFIIYILLC